MSEYLRFREPHCHPAPYILGTPANIRTNVIFLETSIIDLHFAADTCLSIFTRIFLAGSERIFYFCKRDVSAVQGRFKVVILVPIESAYMTSY